MGDGYVPRAATVRKVRLALTTPYLDQNAQVFAVFTPY